MAAAYPNYTATHPTTYSFPGFPSYVPSFRAFVDDHVPLTAGPYADMASEFHHTILEYHDAFLMDAESVPEFATAGLLAPLDRFITQDAELDWFRIDRFYRGYSAIFEQLSFTSRDANSTSGTQIADATAANATTSNANATSSPNVTSTYGIPVTGAGFMLMYRADVFVAANASVPATWEELLQLARGWAGKDIDSDGRPEYPVCMPRGGRESKGGAVEAQAWGRRGGDRNRRGLRTAGVRGVVGTDGGAAGRCPPADGGPHLLLPPGTVAGLAKPCHADEGTTQGGWKSRQATAKLQAPVSSGTPPNLVPVSARCYTNPSS